VTKPGIFAIALVFVCCLLLVSVDGQEVVNPPQLSKLQWREDLKYFAAELPRHHKNLFHAVSKEQFENAVAKLDADIPSLQDHQIVVRMIQIAAMVGDGHTGVRMPKYFRFYPLSLYWFGNELRVTATTKDYEAALGFPGRKSGQSWY